MASIARPLETVNVIHDFLDRLCPHAQATAEPRSVTIDEVGPRPTPLDWTSAWLYLQPDHDASLTECRWAVVATLRHVRELGKEGLSEREARIYAAWQDVVKGMEAGR